MVILKFVWQVPNFTKVVTSRKFWGHKSKLNLPNTFWAILKHLLGSSLPPSHTMKPQLATLLAGLLAYFFVYLLDCLLDWLAWFAWLVWFAWRGLLHWHARLARSRVKHQKLNQTAPGAVWLSFWCSTYSPWLGLSLPGLLNLAC